MAYVCKPQYVFRFSNASVLSNVVLTKILPTLRQGEHRWFHISPALREEVAGRYKVTKDKSKPLTYEMAKAPDKIAHEKTWNSWNTSNLLDGKRRSETAVDDLFIRRFMVGTWHNLFVSEIIIKRQFNIIRIAGIVQRKVQPRKMYFLIGYSEELLSYWLKCPVKLELQTVASQEDLVYKYI
ncbi:28S ribosomal protein S24 mitochondrial [Trinorchestia longiramus]|nr:28S ribosomal protein S24 mitochondrial [Trinorchestia longiramus]